jgi:myosin heavy chain 6/7
MQVELSQIRAEIEKRLQEKEEEFENTRKAHQRIIEGMQTALEQETRAKAELARVKKKLESDVNVSFGFYLNEKKIIKMFRKLAILKF